MDKLKCFRLACLALTSLYLYICIRTEANGRCGIVDDRDADIPYVFMCGVVFRNNFIHPTGYIMHVYFE